VRRPGREPWLRDAFRSPDRLTEPTGAFLAVTAAATAFAVARGDRRIVAYLVVVALAGAGVALAHHIAPFSRRLRWAATACGSLHLAGGLLPSPDRGAPVLYETWLVDGVVKFDQVVHFTVSATVTVAAGHVLAAWLDPRRCPPIVEVVLAALVANGFGAGNEVVEFLSALRFADAYVGGFENAGWDLVFNAFGSLSAGAVLATTGSVSVSRAPGAVDRHETGVAA
jgi:hypothetical protein